MRGPLWRYREERQTYYFSRAATVSFLMSGAEREALLSEGLTGLFSMAPWNRHSGQWAMAPRLGWTNQLDRIEAHGSFRTNIDAAFSDWVGRATTVSYDDQTGSIGGGNHFVEVQQVEEILDRHTAYEWGLKKGAVTIMVHSGSVAGIGHIAGQSIRELLRGAYPKSTTHPINGLYQLTASHAKPFSTNTAMRRQLCFREPVVPSR